MGPPSSSPLLHPLSSSPSSVPQFPLQADHHRALQEAIDLESCEVYSWFPSPEYDPHAELEEGELSGDEFEPEEEFIDEKQGMDVDINDDETEASWGQAGMDMDVEPMRGGGVMEARRRSKGKENMPDSAMMPPPLVERTPEDEMGRKSGRLLWSTNYFFYSK
jgi:hypothetical protein